MCITLASLESPHNAPPLKTWSSAQSPVPLKDRSRGGARLLPPGFDTSVNTASSCCGAYLCPFYSTEPRAWGQLELSMGPVARRCGLRSQDSGPLPGPSPGPLVRKGPLPDGLPCVGPFAAHWLWVWGSFQVTPTPVLSTGLGLWTGRRGPPVQGTAEWAHRPPFCGACLPCVARLLSWLPCAGPGAATGSCGWLTLSQVSRFEGPPCLAHLRPAQFPPASAPLRQPCSWAQPPASRVRQNLGWPATSTGLTSCQFYLHACRV